MFRAMYCHYDVLRILVITLSSLFILSCTTTTNAAVSRLNQSPSEYYWIELQPNLPEPYSRAILQEDLLAKNGAVMGQGQIMTSSLSSRFSRASLREWADRGDVTAAYVYAIDKKSSSEERRNYLMLASRPDEKLCLYIKAHRCKSLPRFNNGLPAAHFELFWALQASNKPSDRLSAQKHLRLAAKGGYADAYELMTGRSPSPVFSHSH